MGGHMQYLCRAVEMLGINVGKHQVSKKKKEKKREHGQCM